MDLQGSPSVAGREPSSGDPALRVHVLGLVQLRAGRTTIPLTPSERTLLAGIAVGSGRVVTVSALSDWVWGGGHHASPRNRIQALVSAIRRKVAPADIFVTHEVGYQLDEAVLTDLAERNAARRRLATEDLDTTERRQLLRAAAALASGEPLDGCHATPEVDAVRRRLEEEQLELLAERIDADLAAGQLDGLSAELRALTERLPFHETFHAQLMRVLARTGRQADSLAVFRAAYRRLDDELGVRPGPRLTAAHQEVLRSLDDESPAPAGRAAVEEAAVVEGPAGGDTGSVGTPSDGGARAERRATPAPRTAPRTTTRLVGREAELGLILQAAQDETGPAPVVAVSGLGGMGKSTLAIEAAHLLRDRFEDGTLYLDLASETGRAGTSSILALFLGLLGVPGEAVPDGHDARVALYRSVLDDKRVLIVLDGVPDDVDVSALLPSRASSMALLTSRHTLGGCHPSVHVRMTGLPDADAAMLLRQAVGAQRADAEADALLGLVRECRGLPLLLRVTAQRLASRPDLSLRRAVQALSAEIAGRPGTESAGRALHAGLGLAEAPLPAVARAVLAELATLPFPRVSRWVVGAMVGDERTGDDAVDTLHGASFLELVLQQGRSAQFQLHDLVRLYARAADHDLPDDVPTADEPMPRVVARLLELAETHARAFPARLLPLPPGPDGVRGPVDADPDTLPGPDDALAFFRTEQDTLLACVRWAVEHDPASAWRLLATMGNHVQLSVEPGLWITAANAVKAALPDSTPDGRRGHAYLALTESLIRHEASDSRHGAPLAIRARRALVLDGDLHGALAAAVVLGRSQRANGKRAAAEEALTWAGASCTDDTPTELRGYVELAWGSLLDDYDELRPARARLVAALGHLDATDDWSGRATAQFALARVHRRLAEYELGLPLCDSSMELFARLGDINGRTAVLDTRADLLVHMGEPVAALEAAREAVEQAGQRRDMFMLHRARRTVGRALAGVGRLDDAEQALRESVSGFDALGRPLSLAASLRDLGRVLQLVGRVEEAREVFLRERGCLQRAGLTDVSELDDLIARLDARRDGTRHPAPRQAHA